MIELGGAARRPCWSYKWSGIAVLRSAGHQPPVDAITVACGIGALVSAAVGSVCTCLTGPTNAIITSSGERSRHYIAGMMTGVLAIVFGLMAPAFHPTDAPMRRNRFESVGRAGDVAYYKPHFVICFKDRLRSAHLVAFLVTVSDLALLNIGAAFWGLVAGLAGFLDAGAADFATVL